MPDAEISRLWRLSKVQLIEPNDREREALQLLLESMGLGVEVFASVAERAERAPRSGHCVLCTVDGGAPPWHEFDDLLGEIGEGTPVLEAVKRQVEQAIAAHAGQ